MSEVPSTPSKISPVILGGVTLTFPPFYYKNPSVWFSSIESQFVIRGITQSRTKYFHVLANLPLDVAELVFDVTSSPPEENPYEALKQAVISRTSTSTQEKVLNVTQKMTLGSLKPSQLLRNMQQELSSFTVDDRLLSALWVQKLPKEVGMVLAPCAGCPLSVAAEVADNAMAYCTQSHTPSGPSLAGVQGPSQTTADPLAAIVARLDRIELAASQRGRPSSRSRSRSRRSRSRSSRPLCWFHSRWGAKARKCIAPCRWSGPPPQGNA